MRLLSATAPSAAPSPAPAYPSPQGPVSLPALLIGGWGDVLAGLGRLGHSRPGEACDLIYFGKDPAIAEFLRHQEQVSTVRHEIPYDAQEYLRAGLDADALALRFRAENFSPPFQRDTTEEPRRWHGGRLPDRARKWASHTLSTVPQGRRYLVYPRSTDNTSWANHWPGWLGLLEWMTEYTQDHFILCGQGWECKVKHERLYNLIGKTPSMLEVFALADLCDGMICTSSAIALWAVIRRIPAVVNCNVRDTDGGYFYRWIGAAANKVNAADAPFEHVTGKCKELFRRAERAGAKTLIGVPKRLELASAALDAIHLCVPPGIGDISWLYAAGLHALGAETNREVVLYLPDDRDVAAPPEQNAIVVRSEPFIEMLPNVTFGGYVTGRTGWEVVNQSVPMNWPKHMGYGPLRDNKGKISNVSANMHLEMGNALADCFPQVHWETGDPLLPKDYHYDLEFTAEDCLAAERLTDALPRGICAIYVSNRDKEQYPDWKLWTAAEWIEMMELSGAKSFVILGASWDQDKTDDVVALAKERWPVLRLVGQPLAQVLAVMQRCQAGCYFPSGMGILANVLYQPAAMLLPYHLRKLTRFADPEDLAAGRYRCFPAAETGGKPAVAEVAAFLRPHLVEGP